MDGFLDFGMTDDFALAVNDLGLMAVAERMKIDLPPLDPKPPQKAADPPILTAVTTLIAEIRTDQLIGAVGFFLNDQGRTATFRFHKLLLLFSLFSVHLSRHIGAGGGI
jgi:hypothetical protein